MDSRFSPKKSFPQELMGYLQDLRSRVHRYRRYGLLPDGRATRMHAHRGSGLRCVICGEAVLPTEPEIVLEYELDCELAAESPTFRFHHLCHVIWLTEAPPRRERPKAKVDESAALRARRDPS
jgi:hypothetical protein